MVVKVVFGSGSKIYTYNTKLELLVGGVYDIVSSGSNGSRGYAEPQYDDEGNYEVPGIYIMEYVDCDEDVNSDEIWKYGYSQYCKERGLDGSSYDYADDYDEWNWQKDDELVLEYVESQMDDEQRRLFNVFMMKWWISDIHNQNIGHIGNRIVILDYAGWNW